MTFGSSIAPVFNSVPGMVNRNGQEVAGARVIVYNNGEAILQHRGMTGGWAARIRDTETIPTAEGFTFRGTNVADGTAEEWRIPPLPQRGCGCGS